MTLLIALGVIAVATAATLVSLRIVSQESEMQGRERHTREAFFAAEAGLAEGREVITRLVGNNISDFNEVFTRLGGLRKGQPGFNADGEVDEVGFPGNDFNWYEVLPDTRYSLLVAKGALDPAVPTAGKELKDTHGKPFLSFPEQASVYYRVFVHDDADGKPSRTVDDNKAVWVVSVGEVRGGPGEKDVLARSVVRALVFAGYLAPVADGYRGQKGGSSDKTTGSLLENKAPDMSTGVVIGGP